MSSKQWVYFWEYLQFDTPPPQSERRSGDWPAMTTVTRKFATQTTTAEKRTQDEMKTVARYETVFLCLRYFWHEKVFFKAFRDEYWFRSSEWVICRTLRDPPLLPPWCSILISQSVIPSKAKLVQGAPIRRIIFTDYSQSEWQKLISNVTLSHI